MADLLSPAEVLAMLRSVEWEGSDQYNMCPRCQHDPDKGHGPDCALDAMIKRCEAAAKDSP